MEQDAKTDVEISADHLPSGMSPEKFESLCTRCAKCCYQKIIVGRTVMTTPFPCRFLDTEKRTCTVYAERKRKNPRCLGVLEGMKVSAFPADCAYVKTFAQIGYRPAVDSWSWDGQWDDFDDLADDLDVPDYIRRAVRALGPKARLPWEERDVPTAAVPCPKRDTRA